MAQMEVASSNALAEIFKGLFDLRKNLFDPVVVQRCRGQDYLMLCTHKQA